MGNKTNINHQTTDLFFHHTAQLDGIMFTCGVCSFKTVKRDNYLAHVAEHSRSDAKRMRQAASSNLPARKGHEPEVSVVYNSVE